MVQAAMERAGPSAIALLIGVPAQTLKDFAAGSVYQPRAKAWTAIREWAVSRRGFPPKVVREPGPPYGEDAIVRDVIEQTTANLKSLAEIRAYAQAVWDMILAVGERQGKVVGMLGPHVDHEQRHPKEQAWRDAIARAEAADDAQTEGEAPPGETADEAKTERRRRRGTGP